MNHLPSLVSDELKALGEQGFALALRMLRHREDAADAVQDAMQQMFRGKRSFNGELGSVKSWFLKIVRNRCVDMQRKRRPVTGEAIDPVDSVSIGPDEISQRNEIVGLVRKALDDMPEAAREIVLLRDFHGLSYAEISDVLGVASGTVMSRLHRARLEIRHKVNQIEKANESI